MHLRTNTCRTTRRALAAAALLGAMASTAMGQFSETEPNGNRDDMNQIGFPTGVSPGATITAVSTGTSQTAGLATDATADFFNVKIAESAPAIYRNRWVITGPHAATYNYQIRGYNQTAAGITIPGDGSLQNAATVGADRFVQWYGFGRGETTILRFTGAAATTNPYTLTFQQQVVSPTVASTPFNVGTITIAGSTTANTDFWVYDSTFTPVDGFGNDNGTAATGGPGVGSDTAVGRKVLTAGRYYVAMGLRNVANDQRTPVDDGFRTGQVLATPHAILASSTTNGNVSFTISDGVQTQSFSFPTTDPLEIKWVQFDVVGDPPIMASGAVNPNPITPPSMGTTPALITVSVTPSPGANNAIESVTVDLSTIGGPSSQSLFDNGTNGDTTPNDLTYSFTYNVPYLPIAGARTLDFRVEDASDRVAIGGIATTINPAVPPNDSCQNPIVLGNLSLGFSTVIGINAAMPDGSISCSTSLMQNGIWFSYTPSTDVLLEIDENSGFDAAFQIYKDGCPGTGGDPFECNTADTDVVVQLEENTEYLILVGKPSGTASTSPNDVFDLVFRTSAPDSPPSNDTCFSPLPLLADGAMHDYAAGGATSEPASDCQGLTSHADEARNGIWFTYNPGNQNVIGYFLRTSATTNQMSVQVYTDLTCQLDGDPPRPTPFGTPYTCADVGTSFGSTTDLVEMRANTTYWFLVHRRSGFMPAGGEYEFSFTLVTGTQLANIDCATAEPISVPFSATVDNTLGFNEPSLTNCILTSPGVLGGGVWYSFTPMVASSVQVLRTSPTLGGIAAFEGSCSGPRVMCATLGFDNSESSRFQAYPGITYYIVIGSDTTGIPPGTTTPLQISIDATPVPVPVNDDCETATAITSLPFVETTNVGTARDDLPGVLCDVTSTGNVATTGIWYSYHNGSSTAAAVMTETGSLNSFMASFRGECGALTAVSCTGSPEGSAYLIMDPNTTYYFLVGNGGNFPGLGEFTFGFDVQVPPSVPAPVNQDCAHAEEIVDFPFVYASAPVGSRHGIPSSCASAGTLGEVQATNPLWYEIHSGSGFTLQLYEPSFNDIDYVLYSGSCESLSEAFCTRSDGTLATPMQTTLLPSTTYYLMVSRNSDEDLVPGASVYNLNITAAAGTSGACCTGTTCSISTIESCAERFVPGGACETTDCGGETDCDVADFNNDGTVQPADIFFFLDAWFAQLCSTPGCGAGASADIDGNGIIQPADIFFFLDKWFANLGPC